MLQIGDAAPNFNLPATDGKMRSLEEFSSFPILVLFFTCNHCPYVIGSDEVTRSTAEKFLPKGAVFVAINSNSEELVPEDSFVQMGARMKQFHFPWAYLHDAAQTVARAYGAIKTPQFFLFDSKRKLVYTGRGVDSPRDAHKITVNDLERALEELFAHKPISQPITEPIGCSIKWDPRTPKPEYCDR